MASLLSAAVNASRSAPGALWKRLPHQFVLALAFGIIGAAVAVAIARSTASAVAQSDATIAYAANELRGIGQLSRTHEVLRELLAYRAALMKSQLRSRLDTPLRVAVRAGPLREKLKTISVSIAAISEAPPATGAVDKEVAGEVDALARRWLRTAAQRAVSAEDVSDVIATIQPLLNGIAGASGLSNDPSIDGINFEDAITRFPLALAYATQAGAIALRNTAAGNADLGQRFAAARLLAQAETAIDVGSQDVADEMSVDAAAATPLAAQAAANMRDFETLRDSITSTYVESAETPIAKRGDPELLRERDMFTSASFAIIDALGAELRQVTGARIDAAEAQRRRSIATALGGVSLDLLTMLALAGISIVSYRNARERVAAERVALDAQRTSLEAELTHAKAEQALLNTKAQFRAVFDRAPTGMIIVDRDGNVLDTNAAAQAMLEPGGDRVTSLNTVISDQARNLDQVFRGGCDVYSEERRYESDGRALWLQVSISPINDKGAEAIFAILMIRDITASKSMEVQLVFEAEHDELTGLPNRKRFLAVLQQALDDRERSGSSGSFSVVFIDFNDFKTINDSLGHTAGDTFLINGAARLRDSVRSTDVVARIGGDEFAVLLHGHDRTEIEKSVTRLQSAVSVPVSIDGQLVASSASFGIAQAEPHYTSASEIIRDADTAMYQAKARGDRRFVVFDRSMRERVVRRMQLAIDIVHALEFGEMAVFYQPIVHLEDGKIAGCEALLRWRRADGVFISPAEFIPLAEENGSIIEIGRWVTTTVCKQLSAWKELAERTPLPGLCDDFVIHVNLAVPEMHHVDLLESLRRTLAESHVPREQIILEITEGIVLKNTPHMRARLDALTEDGFRLCIDDFGTGYSSLRYLNDLPLHGFKIDRAFVSNGGDELANASIVEMLMVLSRSLDLEVVAEGIETRAQWAKLRELGCRYGQGYLFSQALDQAAFTTLLQAERVLSPPDPSVVAYLTPTTAA